mmetsp:Transcript_28644/g.66026  ORF Transcript_28644/g.66026 Transcript_28644/m.66026 type:complete len:204 (-) Transcript_28644:113-724(-)
MEHEESASRTPRILVRTLAGRKACGPVLGPLSGAALKQQLIHLDERRGQELGVVPRLLWHGREVTDEEVLGACGDEEEQIAVTVVWHALTPDMIQQDLEGLSLGLSKRLARLEGSSKESCGSSDAEQPNLEPAAPRQPRDVGRECHELSSDSSDEEELQDNFGDHFRVAFARPAPNLPVELTEARDVLRIQLARLATAAGVAV